jgi:hypothetical protein
MTKEAPGPGQAAEIGAPPYGWAALAGALVGLLYVVTLAPTTAFWDTSEYIATAHILGIPHPPGNPLFVVLARAWDLILAPLGLPVAVRINLFSAAMSAGAHGLWFLVVHRVLGFFSPTPRFRIGGAMIAVLVSATAFTVWNQSNVNEKVYTVSLFTIALLSWLAFHWRDNLGRGKDDNLLVLMVFILALSVGNHLMAFLAAPALGLFILLVHPRTLLNWKLYPAAVVVVLLGISIHLFLPLRAGLDPVISEADPTCESLAGAVTSVVTYGQRGCESLNDALTRQQYDKPPLVPRQADLASQIANYVQYFDWQWARSLEPDRTAFSFLRLPFTFLFAVLGIIGCLEHRKRDRKSWLYVLALFATLSVALIWYLNFKYGFSLRAPVDDRSLHEVRERDYFFIVSFSVWGLWAGVGVAAIWLELGKRLRGGLVAASPVLTLAFIPLVLNWPHASRAGDYATRDWAYNLLMSVEPYAVLFTNGDNDTFPLWYLQEVEGIRRDVTVLVTSYLNTDWYVKQVRDLTAPCAAGEDPAHDPTRIICQRPYTADNTDAAYTADPGEAQAAGKVPLVLSSPIMRPTGPVFNLDDNTIEQVAGTVSRLDSERTVVLGNLTATLRAGQLLLPWHQFALLAIATAIGERPIYFATSGNAAETLGVANHLVRQGLAFRLNDGPLDPESLPDGVVRTTPSPLANVTGPWIDVDRTARLLDEVYVHRGGIPDEWDVWPDRSTLGIPNYYAWSYYSVAQGALQMGQDERMEASRERGDAWAELGN